MEPIKSPSFSIKNSQSYFSFDIRQLDWVIRRVLKRNILETRKDWSQKKQNTILSNYKRKKVKEHNIHLERAVKYPKVLEKWCEHDKFLWISEKKLDVVRNVEVNRW